MILAFFPCIRFEVQAVMLFKGTQYQIINKTLKEKLELDLKYHKELSELYELVTKLVIVCIDRNIKLVVENPANEQHYLTRYWALSPSIIDGNRYLKGDYCKKPTQYFFINCEPKNNLIFEPYSIYEKPKAIHKMNWGDSNKRNAERSMISPEYANRFIRENIIDGETKKQEQQLKLDL